MGVSRSDYIMIGVDVGYKNFDEEKYSEHDIYLNKKDVGEIAYVLDWMSEEYFIVGVILVIDKRGYNGFPLVEFSLENNEEYNEYKEIVKNHIKENFDLEVEPKLLVFTHWS